MAIFEIELSWHYRFIVEADDEAAAIAHVEQHADCGCLQPEASNYRVVVVGEAEKRLWA
jgi:hypothetical protein